MFRMMKMRRGTSILIQLIKSMEEGVLLDMIYIDGNAYFGKGNVILVIQIELIFKKVIQETTMNIGLRHMTRTIKTKKKHLR